MSRTTDRIHAFNLIFMWDFHKSDENLDKNRLIENYFNASFFEGSFSETGLPDKSDADRAFVEGAFFGVLKNLEDIDKSISDHCEGWELSRLMKTDLAILRLGLYEILFDKDVPPKVSINEAVELSKTYSGDDSPGFVNGVMGKILKLFENEA